MSDNSKILIGKIVAAQGLRGEVRVQTYTQNPDDLKNLPVIDMKLNFIRAKGHDTAIIKIDGVNDRTSAENLRGTELYVLRDDLPKLNDGEYYHIDLIGMKVVRGEDVLGVVTELHNFGAGDILELENGEMISFARAETDFENKVIFVK